MILYKTNPSFFPLCKCIAGYLYTTSPSYPNSFQCKSHWSAGRSIYTWCEGIIFYEWKSEWNKSVVSVGVCIRILIISGINHYGVVVCLFAWSSISLPSSDTSSWSWYSLSTKSIGVLSATWLYICVRRGTSSSISSSWPSSIGSCRRSWNFIQLYNAIPHNVTHKPNMFTTVSLSPKIIADTVIVATS